MKAHRSKIILGILATLVVVGGAGIWFGYDMLRSVREDQQAMRQKIAEEESRTSRLASLKNAFANITQETTNLDEFFYASSEEDWLRFVTEIERMYRASGVSATVNIGEFSPNAAVFTEEIKFTGTWDQAYRLLRLIESFPGRLAVKNFSLQSSSQAGGITSAAQWQGIVFVELRSIKKFVK